ncbi:MAG: hypothetical protein ABFD89_23810 [Bryobacteraceae bacterium]
MYTPQVYQGPGDRGVLSERSLVTPKSGITESAHGEIGLGSFLFVDSSVYLRAIKTADAGANARLKYQVTKILLADGKTPKRVQYLTKAEANSGSYKLAVIPVGGVIFEIQEDADGGKIADANAFGYCDLIVGTAADTAVGDFDGSRIVHANIKLDSSSASTTAGNLLMELLGPSPQPGNPTVSATAPRRFLARVRSTLAQASQ